MLKAEETPRQNGISRYLMRISRIEKSHRFMDACLLSSGLPHSTPLLRMYSIVRLYQKVDVNRVLSIPEWSRPLVGARCLRLYSRGSNQRGSSSIFFTTCPGNHVLSNAHNSAHYLDESHRYSIFKKRRHDWRASIALTEFRTTL
jgi:hypothetical protein